MFDLDSTLGTALAAPDDLGAAANPSGLNGVLQGEQSMTKKASAVRCQEGLARNIARIRGENSPAAEALRDLESRRAAGETAIIYSVRGRWLVGDDTDIHSAITDSRLVTERALAKAKTRRTSNKP